jgi:hypothetical protein
MLPGELNITVYRGDSFSYELRVLDADLRGCALLAQVREQYSDAAVTLSLNTSLAYQSPDTLINLEQSAAALQAISPGGYVWDLQVTTVAGLVGTYTAGEFTILPDVSRA